jgi:Domain of unknown function (DUF1906)
MRQLRSMTLSLLLVLAVMAVVGAGFTSSRAATPIQKSDQSKAKGFDRCQAPIVSNMQNWWDGTAYWYVGVYIGGSNRSCDNNHVDKDWISRVDDIGFGFLPIWVGPQPPCTNYGDTFSSDTDTARNRGKQAADYAGQKSLDLGMVTSSPNPPIIYYDLEGYGDVATEACRDATNAFINGWVSQLRDVWGRKAGVYGAGCGSFIDDWWSINNRPDDVWIARWTDSDPSVYNVTCVPRNHWEFSRIRQYKGNVPNECHNGTCFDLIDKNCARGSVTGDNGYYGDEAACYSG